MDNIREIVRKVISEKIVDLRNQKYVITLLTKLNEEIHQNDLTSDLNKRLYKINTMVKRSISTNDDYNNLEISNELKELILDIEANEKTNSIIFNKLKFLIEKLINFFELDYNYLKSDKKHTWA